jgi:cell division protein FtsZ
MTLIHNTVSSEANVYFGQVVDETMEDRIKVTVIATNFDRKKDHADRKPEQQDLFEAPEEKKPTQPSFNLDEPAFLRKRNK